MDSTGASSVDAGIVIAILALVGTFVTAAAGVLVAYINRPRREPPVTSSPVTDELVRELAELLHEERERREDD